MQMLKTYQTAILIFLLVLGVFIYVESSTPEPVDWSPTYSTKHKIPLGTYIFYDQLQKKAQVETVEDNPYDFLSDTTHTGTYMFVGNSVSLSWEVGKQLMKWVGKGNTLFISARYFDVPIMDSLYLEVGSQRAKRSIKSYPTFSMVNPKLDAARVYTFEREGASLYFENIDTLPVTVLGQSGFVGGDRQMDSAKSKVNYLQLPVGEGKLLFHTAPEAFSNYFLLGKDNYRYTESVLAYIDLNQPVYFDVYYDSFYHRENLRTSPLYVFLENKYLKWGYYLFLIGIGLFIIFEGKRKQKAIRIIEPLENKSYSYTRTIAGLYLKKKDHTAIAHKKIAQFLNYIRLDLRVELYKVDREVIARLTELTGYTEKELQDLFKEIKRLQQKKDIFESELKALNKRINEFKRKSNGK